MTAAICETEDLRRSLRAPHADTAVRGVVVTYPLGDAALHNGHMAATRHEIARRLSALMGYAYATPWRVRSAYRFSVESSVYVSPDHPRKGVGTRLYRQLIDELRARGLHMVIGGIAQPNEASVALHEAMGFKKVAHFSEVGMKFGRWIDVGYWELKLA